MTKRKHKKTGGIYERVGVTRMQVNSNRALKDMDEVIVYRSRAGLLWVREGWEFLNQFESVVDEEKKS